MIQPIHEQSLVLDLVSRERRRDFVRGTTPIPLEEVRVDFHSGYVQLQSMIYCKTGAMCVLLIVLNAVRHQFVGGNGESCHIG